MLYLLLAIFSTAGVSVFMRISNQKTGGGMPLLLVNYVVCTAMAALYTHSWDLFPVTAPQFSFAMGLGVVAGFLYLFGFVMLQWSVVRNGVTLSSTFMKLGVMVPTLMAIVVFREQPRLPQLLGLGLAVAAILLIQLDGQTTGGAAKKSTWGLLLLLLAGGFCDGTSKIYSELGNAALESHFLFYTFGVALLLCLGMMLWKKEKLTLPHVGFGLLLGIPNYFACRFLLLSLGTVPAVVAYPTYSVGGIVVTSLAGMLLFKERLNKRQWLGMAVIMAALVLLNL